MSVTLEKVVRSSLMNHNQTLALFERYLHFAIRGYREMDMDMGRQICTTSCEINSYKAIKLPDDFLSLIKIGVEVNGVIRSFAHDGSIPLNPQTREQFETTKNTTPIEQLPFTGGNYFFSFYRNKDGSSLGREFGLVEKTNGTGYYRINHKVGEIQLNPLLWPSNKQIYIEYIGSVVVPGKETHINPLAEELIGRYIDWQIEEYTPKASANQKMRKKDLYDQEFSRLAGRLMDWDAQDLKDLINQHFHLTVRT